MMRVLLGVEQRFRHLELASLLLLDVIRAKASYAGESVPMNLTKRISITTAILAGFFSMPATDGVTVAGTIAIDIDGLDAVFDGTDITNAGGASGDPLGTVTITTTDPNGTTIIPSGATIEFIVPDVDPIPTGGGAVSAGDTGEVTLSLPGGDFVSLDLGPATVTYIDVGGTTALVFSTIAADDDSVSQSLATVLPAGFEIDDPITFTFAAIVDSSTDDAGFITSFTAAGGGSIDGTVIPEPSSGLLVGLTAGAMGLRRRR